MWRRTYLILLLVRVYFALSPSYLHPDEIFQGPEVVAGSLFPYPSVRTWEWTVAQPVRSVFPLWPFYSLPMILLKALWPQDSEGIVPPEVIYYTLRAVMFTMTFVLEDWAIYELVSSPRRRLTAVTLVASSYVTWTFQTHTFSNSVETLLVLWCLVLMERITHTSQRHVFSKGSSETDDVRPRSSITSSLLLGFLLALGLFNRITFPAFVLIPGIRVLPHFRNRPWSFVALIFSGIFWTTVAIATDTAFYSGPAATTSFGTLFQYMRLAPVITPLNNLLYNTQTSNLAEHGLHPHYQHFLVNLPQLLGPALVLLIMAVPFCAMEHVRQMLRNSRLTSAATGTLILSIIPHQEPRFLLPCIPLLLTCVRFPQTLFWKRIFWMSWGVFNVLMSILMGIYHQGGVIPIQMQMSNLLTTSLNTTSNSITDIEVFWWKTYPPPTFLLGPPLENPVTGKAINLTTISLLGAKQYTLGTTLSVDLPSCDAPSFINRISETLIPSRQTEVYLAAPFSAFRFNSETNDSDIQAKPPSISNFSFDLSEDVHLTHLATHRQHINLDDMDFGDDGIINTLSRVIGRRGLGVWKVNRICDED